MIYTTPRLTAFGSVSAMTGIFGSSSPEDVLVNENGQTVMTGQLSVDACAEENEKCICTDNGSC